jgi:hypothetical protein
MLRRIASFANHLSLTLRVVLGSTVVLVGVAAALTWRATEANQKAVIQQLEARTRGAMNLTIARLQALGPIRVQGDKLFAGTTLLNDFHPAR